MTEGELKKQILAKRYDRRFTIKGESGDPEGTLVELGIWEELNGAYAEVKAIINALDEARKEFPWYVTVTHCQGIKTEKRFVDKKRAKKWFLKYFGDEE